MATITTTRRTLWAAVGFGDVSSILSDHWPLQRCSIEGDGMHNATND
jgi:hypothetical protein